MAKPPALKDEAASIERLLLLADTVEKVLSG
jgi:hypothetical protein